MYLALLILQFLLLSYSNALYEIDPSRVTQLSFEPRIFQYSGFLSNEECDHLISLAKDYLRVSVVVDSVTEQPILSNVRTSSGMFLRFNQDAVVSRIEQRIAAWTFLPIENGEALQILRYRKGEKYEAHTDFNIATVNEEIGGYRYATVLLYLSTVGEGGETIFPKAQVPFGVERNISSSDCAKRGIAVKPVKGDAVIFFNLYVNGTPNSASMHGSCPVIEGEKWSATKWIRLNSIRSEPVKGDESGCIDQNPNCMQWAAAGECEKSRLYMVGSEGNLGFCRKSCGVCVG